MPLVQSTENRMYADRQTDTQTHRHTHTYTHTHTNTHTHVHTHTHRRTDGLDRSPIQQTSTGSTTLPFSIQQGHKTGANGQKNGFGAPERKLSRISLFPLMNHSIQYFWMAFCLWRGMSDVHVQGCEHKGDGETEGGEGGGDPGLGDAGGGGFKP